MLKIGKSSYINDIFLNDLGGACPKFIVFERFWHSEGAIAEAVWRFRGV